MKTHKSNFFQPKVKLPVKLAPKFGCSADFVRKWNRGDRQLSVDLAIIVLQVMREHGYTDIRLEDIWPKIKELRHL